MKTVSLFLTALSISLATTFLPSCVTTQQNAPKEDLPFTPCMTEPSVGALPDSYILESWPLEEPVKRFYQSLHAWRKLPKPQGYSLEVACQDMRDTLTDAKLMLALKGLYGALDPGSAAFHSFLETGRQEVEQKQYPRQPATYYRALRTVAEERYGHSPFFMLAFADGIFEIEVNRVNTDTWFIDGEWVELEDRDPTVCVSAGIVDTLKGAWLLERCAEKAGDTREESKVCLLFTYNKSWSTYDDGSTVGTQPSRATYGEIHHPKAGDHYLVFVDLHVHPADSTGRSVFSVNPMRDMQREGGLFKIIDGKVQDSSNYFGLGTNPDIYALKAKLRSIIAEKLRP